MNINYTCEDCNKTTGGRCWKHSSQTVVFGPPATHTHSVFVDNGVKSALQKLVNKLEMIEKDEYFHSLRSLVFSQWKNELAEAKKALEESNKPPIVLCTGHIAKDIDLFDNAQLDLPLKHEEEL